MQKAGEPSCLVFFKHFQLQFYSLERASETQEKQQEGCSHKDKAVVTRWGNFCITLKGSLFKGSILPTVSVFAGARECTGKLGETPVLKIDI